MKRILGFLDLPASELIEYKTYNAFSSGTTSPSTRERLVELFRPHNQRLYELLGRDLGWDA